VPSNASLRLAHGDSKTLMTPGDRQQRLAFTVIELLVTVAIIAVLASLVVTAVLGAKAKAHSVTCLGNLHQHGIALASWLADHHSFPLAFSDRIHDVTEERYVSWPGALFPKVKFDSEARNGIFNCPAVSRPSELPDGSGFCDYGYNAWGFNGPGQKPLMGVGGHGPAIANDGKTFHGSYAPPVRESEAKNPAGLLVIGDSFIGWKDVIEDGKFFMGRTASAIDTYGSSKRAPARHRKRANMVFGDGHTATLPLTYLFTDMTDDRYASGTSMVRLIGRGWWSELLKLLAVLARPRSANLAYALECAA
jgi:prepilin-type processing-associated H-X9-DG protein/prepilin-type N-terminal cleavage/methylation domain-containing protein